MTKQGGILLYKKEIQSFKGGDLVFIRRFLTASNNSLSLWSRLLAPEQLSNSPSHLQGQHAGHSLHWQLRSDLYD
jgi:hypothetical protein